MYVHMYTHLCIYIHTHTHTYIYIYIYIYIYVGSGTEYSAADLGVVTLRLKQAIYHTTELKKSSETTQIQ
jgi:hypothetical protein